MNTVGAIIKFKWPAGLSLKASQYVRQLVTRGGVPSRELTQHVLIPVAVVLLSKVVQAFIQKSRGETGSDGIRWKPLSPRTIAARRTTRAEKKALGMTGRRTRGNLTPAQDRRFKDIFGTRLARFLATGMEIGEAKERAGRIAWATVIAEGAKTKLMLLGSRKVDIGRDTGALLRSLTPGTRRVGEAIQSPVAPTPTVPVRQRDQVLEFSGGFVAVGSLLPYAERFHRVRPLWPANIPAAWMPEITAAFQRGMVRLFAGKL